MLRVVINGCNGRMGKVISKQIEGIEDMSVIAGVDSRINPIENAYPVYERINQIEYKTDVIIDFSNRKCLMGLLEYAVNRKVSLVIATTGLSEEDLLQIKRASQDIPVFHSANTSLGINVLLSLVQRSVEILSDTFDIEIIEKHHNEKLDAPSGTAYMIANAINEVVDDDIAYNFGRQGSHKKRRKNEIGIHAIRGGTIAGEHVVLFAGEDEIIEIKHTALSKRIFANGAIKAARFVSNQKPGLYNMDDLINYKGK